MHVSGTMGAKLKSGLLQPAIIAQISSERYVATKVYQTAITARI